MPESPRDPYQFWDLDPDHPLDAEGYPCPERVGVCEIVYLTVAASDEQRDDPSLPDEAPDFAVHVGVPGVAHACHGHFHKHNYAVVYAALMNAMQGWRRAELRNILMEIGVDPR